MAVKRNRSAPAGVMTGVKGKFNGRHRHYHRGYFYFAG